jgi:hypothetical protein
MAFEWEIYARKMYNLHKELYECVVWVVIFLT